MNLYLFLIAGLMAITGALGLILAKQPVHQVLATVLNFLGLAALFLSLNAEFMAVIQLIIYGGAVMILFLFVIALLSARKDPMERDAGQLPGQAAFGWGVGGAVAVMLALIALLGKPGGAELAKLSADFGSTKHFGMELLTTNLFAFEMTAFVLMVAVIGVVILVGRQKA